ncbi:MAG: hypothetical protein AAF666_06840 [Pseudomonadota bacterium]
MSDMSFADLHAGLIERAKPRHVLPRVVVPLQPSPEQRCDEPLRRHAVAREIDLADLTPVNARPVPKSGCPVQQALTKPLPGTGPQPEIVPAAVEVPARRHGLTVRVDPAIRGQLVAVQRKSGRTAQHILHHALTEYLNRLGT